MAWADWKRYFVVVYDRPPPFRPVVWRDRRDALRFFESERRGCEAMPYEGMARPIGIARVRGTRRNVALQGWLNEHAR